MTELERRALLGDVEAQKQCTEQGVVLPCPKCYGESNVYHLATNAKLCIGFAYVYCEKCGLQTKATWPPMPYEDADKKAILQWNTRHAPPIGKCGQCAKLKRGGSGYGWCNGFPKMFYQFCDKFTPKEENKNG